MGVLALQGDSREHIQALQLLGYKPVAVKHPEHLIGLDAIVLPGGESTTIAKLLKFSDLWAPMSERVSQGNLAVMGTCAGMIISAKTVLDGRADQDSLGIFDATVRRNGLGRQSASFEADVDVKGLDTPFGMVFIRGPVVEQVSGEVEILAEWEGKPALCAQGPHLFATFHPELTTDGRIHQLFLDRVEEQKQEK